MPWGRRAVAKVSHHAQLAGSTILPQSRRAFSSAAAMDIRLLPVEQSVMMMRTESALHTITVSRTEPRRHLTLHRNGLSKRAPFWTKRATALPWTTSGRATPSRSTRLSGSTTTRGCQTTAGSKRRSKTNRMSKRGTVPSSGQAPNASGCFTSSCSRPRRPLLGISRSSATGPSTTRCRSQTRWTEPVRGK